MPLRCNQVADRIPVPVGVVEDENVIHKGQPVLRQFAFQIAVVHHHICTAIAAPPGGIFTGRGCDHLYLAVVLRKRDRQRSHAARTADDQQGFVRTGILNIQPFKQAFPRGERGQRQRGGSRPAEA